VAAGVAVRVDVGAAAGAVCKEQVMLRLIGSRLLGQLSVA
jgi:hypothetical protein